MHLRTIWMTALAALSASALANVAAAERHPEGVVREFAAGDDIEWLPPREEYFLVIAAGEEGAKIDVRGLGTSYVEETTQMQPGKVEGSLVKFNGTDPRAIRILEGSGRVVLARVDLQRGLPIGAPPSRMEASARLAAGDCRAYYFDTTFMREPFILSGHGNGALFAMYSSDLLLEEEARSDLNATRDSLHVSSVVMTACAPPEDAASVSILMLHPAPASVEQDRRIVPGAEASALVLGAAAALAFRRLRRA